MTRRARERFLVGHLPLAAALALGLSLPAEVQARSQFDEADIFFELNSTDGDVGVHVSLDAESWKELRILDPRRREIVEVEPEGSTSRIGLTELFFEGEEPPLSEVSFARFLRLFPPGHYVFLGWTVGNELLRSADRLSPDLPCPVKVVSPLEDEVVASDALVIRWRTVPGVYTAMTASLLSRVRAQEEQGLQLSRDLDLGRRHNEHWSREMAGRLRELGAAIQAQFEAWGLTPAEQEVGLLILKAFSHKEIARQRRTSEATIRQQAAAIYDKANLTGRAALSAYFLEGLLLPGPAHLAAAAPGLNGERRSLG